MYFAFAVILGPRKIQPVSAVSSQSGGIPERAIDGGIGPAFTTNQCFVSGKMAILHRWFKDGAKLPTSQNYNFL